MPDTLIETLRASRLTSAFPRSSSFGMRAACDTRRGRAGRRSSWPWRSSPPSRRRPSRGCTTRSPSATAPRSSSSPSGSRFPSCFAPSCGLGFAARRAHGRPLPRRRARPRSIRSQPGRRNPPALNCHPTAAGRVCHPEGRSAAEDGAAVDTPGPWRNPGVCRVSVAVLSTVFRKNT